MLPRVLEPEVMDTIEEAVGYDSMDHGDVNRRFVNDLLAAWRYLDPIRSVSECLVADLGTGTALIPLLLFHREPAIGKIIACDLAIQMLKIANQHIQRMNASCIQTLFCDCKQLPITDASQDIVISNSIVHHIPKPKDVLSEAIRILKPGGLLFVRDLMRPETNQQVEQFVQTYAKEETAEQQQLFRQSLHAALSVEEIGAMLSDLNVPADCVKANSDRHWTICYHKSIV